MTCLSNIKGLGRLWFLSSTSVWIKKNKNKTLEKVKEKWNNAYVQKYTEKCVLEGNVVLIFHCVFFPFSIVSTLFSISSKSWLVFRPTLL